MSDDPTITIKLTAYEAMRDAGKAAHEEAMQFRKELDAARLTNADDSGMTKQLYDAFHQAMKIVQFAVGNLNPETIVGWPHEALTSVATALETIPGIERHLTELPDDLRRFAQHAAALEHFRKERDKFKVVVMASASDFGPKTPEAAAVHAASRFATTQVPAEPDPTPPDAA